MVKTRKKVYTTVFASRKQKCATVRKSARSSSRLTPAPADSNQNASPASNQKPTSDSNQTAAPDSNQTGAPDSSQKPAPASVPAANAAASRSSNSCNAAAPSTSTSTTPDAPASARTPDAAMPHRKRPSCIKEPKSHVYRVRQKRPSASSASHRAAKKREYFQFDCQFDLILYSIRLLI